MQLLEIVEKLDENERMIKTLTKLIVTENGAISHLRNTHYPMLLSAYNRLAIKNKTIFWVCKGEFEEGTKRKRTREKRVGKEKVRDENHLW
jgi:hypothetical protein